MTQYRVELPQLGDRLFISDGGLETTLLFKEGWDLPHFAAFDLLKDQKGTEALVNYYLPYLAIARDHGVGFILETPTWRANNDWGEILGYNADQLAAANRRSIKLLQHIRDNHQNDVGPMVVSGCVGPRGDGYAVETQMTVADAKDYHMPQLVAFAEAGADMASAITMTNGAEAAGIVLAAQAANLPVAISFTVETDGKLPSGETLGEVIGAVDQQTGSYPAYYMVNCAHPTHFEHLLDQAEPWVGRVRGVRANASQCSHAELDEATELDDGNPQELGMQYAALCGKLPNVRVLGGCCGTDHRHIREIANSCAPLFGR